MNSYDISVKVTGYEYYTVEANSEDEAIDLIKSGEGYLQSSEVEWDGCFYVDDITPIVGDENGN